MEIREMERGDLQALFELYTQLHGKPMLRSNRLEQVWTQIQRDPNHRIFVGVQDDEIVSTCVLVIVPNLTRGQRPYALIENVVTDQNHRGRGYATDILNHAGQIAQQNGCYKIMLLTSSKLESTLRFYERAGYNREDKTAFIRWL